VGPAIQSKLKRTHLYFCILEKIIFLDYQRIGDEIIDLKNADLALRDELVQSGQISEGYHPGMKAMHDRNAELLNNIIDRIGYPTIGKVGKEASEAAWLVIQHSIGKPAFMKKCLILLERAVNEHKAEPRNLAYLSDRIAVFEGRPQLYGTQFDWDESGLLSPSRYDDVTKVNERRRSIGLNTLEEQTEIIRRNAMKENHTPPSDLAKRKEEADVWSRQVGWSK
jgi:hypothetical protein